MAVNTQAPLTVTRAHYAALRGWLQGLPVEAIAGRWLSADPDDFPTPAAALATLHTIRDQVVQRARLHGREDLAEACAAPGRSGVGMDRAIDAVRLLETLGTPAPQPDHSVHLWLASPLACRLQRAGVATLADLVALCNQRGRSWWRQVPRVGPLAAQRIIAMLDRHADTVGKLGAHVTAIPVPVVPSTLQPGSGTAVPLEAMRLPRQLDGGAGRNRAPRQSCVIAAQDDYQAIQSWLALWPAASQTYRAYRKEAERFLAWVIVERGKAFSDAMTDDCIAYRAFLVEPQPAAQWCGPRAPREISIAGMPMANPAWRPFTGPLSARSCAYSETVLTALCAWLVGRQYLVTNPWDGLPAQRVAAQTLQVEKAVPPKVWERMNAWLEDQAAVSPRARLWRAAVLLLRETGMRCEEAAKAEVDNLVPLATVGGKPGNLRAVWGELRVTGKGGRPRHVPVSHKLWHALSAHWNDRNTTGSGPLLASLPGEPRPPRAKAKASEGRAGYSDRGLRQLVEQAADAFGKFLEVEDPEMRKTMGRLHPHAFRHAFGSHGLAAGMGIEVVQSYLGHASLATTTLYSTTGRDRRLQDVEKLYSKD